MSPIAHACQLFHVPLLNFIKNVSPSSQKLMEKMNISVGMISRAMTAGLPPSIDQKYEIRDTASLILSHTEFQSTVVFPVSIMRGLR